VQRLLNPLIEKANKQTASWFHDYREKILSLTKDPFEVNELIAREQLKRLFHDINKNEFFIKQ